MTRPALAVCFVLVAAAACSSAAIPAEPDVEGAYDAGEADAAREAHDGSTRAMADGGSRGRDGGREDSRVADAMRARADASSVSSWALSCHADAATPADGGVHVVASGLELTPPFAGDTLAIGCESAYWLSDEDTLLRVPLVGGTVSTLDVSDFEADGEGIVVDGTNLYWNGSAKGGGEFIYKASLSGGDLVTLAKSTGEPTRVAIDDVNVYWQELEGPLWKVPKAGGSATKLAPGPPLSNTGAGGITVAGATVYWSGGDSMLAVPVAGGEVSTLCSRSGAELGAPIVHDGIVYFVEVSSIAGGYQNVASVPVTGGAITTLASRLRNPGQVAVGDTSVYWNDTEMGAIVSVPLHGGTPVTLAASQNQPYPFELAGGSLYWFAGPPSRAKGELLRLTP